MFAKTDMLNTCKKQIYVFDIIIDLDNFFSIFLLYNFVNNYKKYFCNLASKNDFSLEGQLIILDWYVKLYLQCTQLRVRF